MKKNLLTILSFTLFLSFFALPGVSLQAQSVEEGDLTFTPYPRLDLRYYYKKYNLDSHDAANQPHMVATPNPSTDGVIKVMYDKLLGASELVVLDQTGKVVHREPVGSSRETQGVATLNVENFATGLYFFCITTGAYKMVQKVIIR